VKPKEPVAKGALFRNLPYRRSAAAIHGAQNVDHKKTILIALAGNVLIAIAKLAAGLVTHSAAMMAEAAHSFADCINEGFLGLALGRSKKPADPAHPFGFGRARFLWSFVAAISSFIVGGCVSIGLALRQISTGQAWEPKLVAWIVLGIGLLADGASLIQSIDQVAERASKMKIPLWQFLWRTSDPILRAIVVEDCAALIGTLTAASGLLISRLVGNTLPDSIASLLIGLLLAVTALMLARPLADFLIGRTLPEPYLHDIQDILTSSPAVEELIGFHAVYTGPEEVVVAAKIRPRGNNVDDLAKEMDELDHRIKEAVPFVADVFIDVTTSQAHPRSSQ